MLEKVALEPDKRKVAKNEEDNEKPIVFYGKSIYLFIDHSNKDMNRFLRDVCDPVSKPQKVHEYVLTK